MLEYSYVCPYIVGCKSFDLFILSVVLIDYLPICEVAVLINGDFAILDYAM